MKLSSTLTALTITMLLTANAWAVPARTGAASEQSAASYRVKKGDSLYAIGRQTGLTVQELKRLNGLQSDALKPGQILLLGQGGVKNNDKVSTAKPAAASKVLPPSAVARTGVTTTYKVKKGDSLYAIARKNGLSVAELKRLNDLRSDALKPGQKLLIASQGASNPLLAAIDGPTPSEPLCQESADAPEGDLVLLETGLDALEKAALSYLATPYRFGGSSHQGIDCSSFVRNVFRELNIDLPRTAREQYRLGSSIDPGNLQSGDLLFYRTYAKYPSHVGIYLGDQKMIHASPRSRRVVIASVDTPYFRSRFIGAKRLAQLGGNLDLDVLPGDVDEDAEGSLEEAGEPSITAGRH
jgi:LysM repeat protein